jgi:hypothetical protein
MLHKINSKRRQLACRSSTQRLQLRLNLLDVIGFIELYHSHKLIFDFRKRREKLSLQK